MILPLLGERAGVREVVNTNHGSDRGAGGDCVRAGLEGAIRRIGLAYPKGIASSSPALHDEGGLRWVTNHTPTPTPKVVAAADDEDRYNPRWG